MGRKPLPIGKLDSDILKKIVFDKITCKRPEVLVRPGIGEDCAVVDFDAYDCVMSTDPITAAVKDIGRLAVHISCNDIASNGVEPLGIFLAVMLPEGTTEEDIIEIMTQAGKAAADINVEIIGGHTEITNAVNKPVIVSTALGRAPKNYSASAEDMRVGDLILMTKTAGLEGTGIIAGDREDELKDVLTPEEFNGARLMLNQVNVVKEGVAAGEIGTAGMHDITEGGVLGAVWEMCQISGTGAELWQEQIPVSPVTLKICEHFNINYLRLISSGCMIIMVHPEKKDEMMHAIENAGISIACIGRIVGKSEGVRLISGESSEIVAPPSADELYKAVK